MRLSGMFQAVVVGSDSGGCCGGGGGGSGGCGRGEFALSNSHGHGVIEYYGYKSEELWQRLSLLTHWASAVSFSRLWGSLRSCIVFLEMRTPTARFRRSELPEEVSPPRRSSVRTHRLLSWTSKTARPPTHATQAWAPGPVNCGPHAEHGALRE